MAALFELDKLFKEEFTAMEGEEMVTSWMNSGNVKVSRAANWFNSNYLHT